MQQPQIQQVFGLHSQRMGIIDWLEIQVKLGRDHQRRGAAEALVPFSHSRLT